MVVHRACDLMAWSANQLPLPRQVARETGLGWEKGGGPSSRNGWGGEGRRERARVSCMLVVPSSGPMHCEDSPTHPPGGLEGQDPPGPRRVLSVLLPVALVFAPKSCGLLLPLPFLHL